MGKRRRVVRQDEPEKEAGETVGAPPVPEHVDGAVVAEASKGGGGAEERASEGEGEESDGEGVVVEEGGLLAPRKKRKVKGLSAAELEAYNEAQRRRGIVYLSRLPPYMKPAKLRHILSQYGALDRVYLKPEDPNARARRKKMGGNKKKKYTEGWAEFLDKKVAKRVAVSLNGTQIGGRKRDYYFDDLWNMKYLPKFKWHHLTERVAYDNAVRDQRLRAETLQVRRETNQFLEQVTKAKQIMAMERRHTKAGRSGASAGDEHRRPIRQREAMA